MKKDEEKTGKSHGETATKEEENVGGSRGKARKVVYVPARVRQLGGEAEGRRAIRLGGSTRSRWDTCTRQTSILEVALQGRSACHPRSPPRINDLSTPQDILKYVSRPTNPELARCTAITVLGGIPFLFLFFLFSFRLSSTLTCFYILFPLSSLLFLCIF